MGEGLVAVASVQVEWGVVEKVTAMAVVVAGLAVEDLVGLGSAMGVVYLVAWIGFAQQEHRSSVTARGA